MTDTPVMPAFRRGAEEAKEASKGKAFDRTQYFSLDDQESALVRFLTDWQPRPDDPNTGWITVDQHSMVPTRQPKPDFVKGDKWPKVMGAVCRHDKAFTTNLIEQGLQPIFTDCYICDVMRNANGQAYKKQGRSWAYAVLREEVREGGVIKGYRTKTREVTKTIDGQEVTVVEPDVVVVNLAWKNFFTRLDGYGRVYGTILDRDYYILRKGSDTTTDYDVIPKDPLPPSTTSSPNFPHWDARDPAIAAMFGCGDYCPPDQHTRDTIGAVVMGHAEDDFYLRYFIPGGVPSNIGKAEGGAQAAAQPTVAEQQKPPTENVDPAQLQGLAERVKSYATQPGSAVPAGSSVPVAGQPQVPAQPAVAAPPAAAATPAQVPAQAPPAAPPAAPAAPPPPAAPVGPVSYD